MKLDEGKGRITVDWEMVADGEEYGTWETGRTKKQQRTKEKERELTDLGSGEFLLMQKGSDKVHLVVRTVNSAAFSGHDWEEYVVSVSLLFCLSAPLPLFVQKATSSAVSIP